MVNKKRLLILFVFLFLATLLDSYVYPSNSKELRTRCLQIIEEGLLSDNETSRLDSISNIERLKIVNPSIEEKILEIFLKDPSEVVRAASTYSLVRFKGKSAIPMLKKALECKGRQAYLIHLSASIALYNLGEKDSLKVITKYLDSENKAESVEAAISVGNLHNGDIIPLLRVRLSTKNQFLKNALLESLARLGDKISDEAIRLLLESELFDSQWTALSIIDILKDKRFNLKLKKKLESDNPLMRIKTAKLLSILSNENKKSIIIEYLLSDRNSYSGISVEDVKVLAIYNGLFEIGDKSDLPLLKKYLDKGNRERLMAAGSIIAILNRLEESKT